MAIALNQTHRHIKMNVAAPLISPQEVIRKKRDGLALDSAEISAFISGIKSGATSNAQIAAFAMAVFLQNMERAETVALTQAMRDSGEVLDWSDLGGPVVDKHSTGGIGDNVSLILAPIVASCGGYVPMISGRGLGHTGGTLDKLDAITGYNTTPNTQTFRQVVRQTGCAIVGQSADLAPADKKIYAVRDVTSTVESNPLITASILSKKLAAGLGSLVLDVKYGSGSFNKTPEIAVELARLLTSVSNGAGLPTTALVTDMSQPLASAVGNGVEVANAAALLQGTSSDKRLEKVVLELAANMLVISGISGSLDSAKAAASMAVTSGKAAEVFGRMVAGLGGPVDFMENTEKSLPNCQTIMPFIAERAGFLRHIDAQQFGMAVVALGGGRTQIGQQLNYAVGFSQIVPTGTFLNVGDPIAMVHLTSADQMPLVNSFLQNAISIDDEESAQVEPILASIEGDEIAETES